MSRCELCGEPTTEQRVIAAYKRGFEWGVENGPDREYLEKAARDYADKSLSEQ